MSLASSVSIGNVKLEQTIGLAPMAGFSDFVYRRICRKFGAGFSYTEFVPSTGLIHQTKKYLPFLYFTEMERPILFQIFGNNVQDIVHAAKIALELKPDILDINMGCSTVKISQRGCGAGLLRSPILIGQIINALKAQINIPITSKIRIGWDEKNLNYKEVVHILEDSGIDAIFVHGRTRSMGYTGKADWNIIREIKSFSRVPIFGNGDITSPDEIDKRLRESGVDGVLIGRGAIGNPWIFSRLDRTKILVQDIHSVIQSHLNDMLLHYGDPKGLVLFRKHFSRYLQILNLSEEKKMALLTTKDSQEFLYTQSKMVLGIHKNTLITN